MKRVGRKTLPIVLVFCLLVSMMPLTVWADDEVPMSSVAIESGEDQGENEADAMDQDPNQPWLETEAEGQGDMAETEEEAQNLDAYETTKVKEILGQESANAMVENELLEKALEQEDTIIVDFALKGETLHEDAGHQEGQVWLLARHVTVPQGAVVYDVLAKALEEAGLAYEEAPGGYITSIKAPGDLGEYWLGEGDNGPNSAWAFAVNGIQKVNMHEVTVQDGDEILWQYVDDLTQQDALSWQIEEEQEKKQENWEQISYETVLEEAGDYVVDSVLEPTVSSIGGEWAILGLARGGYDVPTGYYQEYYQRVVQKLIDKNGILDKRKYSEYSRVILALTAIGKDVTNVGGYNLLEKLADFQQVNWQGINGSIFALLALDAHDYAIPQVEGVEEISTREKLVAEIIGQEISGGGFSLNGANSSPDPDITAMALQALAPYQDEPEVKAVIERGINVLSELQLPTGGYASMGSETCESAVQVMVALSTLGIDAQKDERFVKTNAQGEAQGLLTRLLQYYVPGGGFQHILSEEQGEPNGMSSEQGYYALVAYDRFLQGENGLYDMTDVDMEEPSTLSSVIKEAQALVETDYSPASWAKFRLVLIAAIAVQDKGNATPEEMEQAANKLTAAIKLLQDQQMADKVIAAINAIPKLENLTSKDKDQVQAVRKAYDALTETQKALVSNLNILLAAEKRLNSGGGPGGSTDIKVSFMLWGDALHHEPSGHKEYDLWISNRQVTIPADSTVWTLFEKVLTEEGLEWDETQPSYIGGIQAPSSFGGHWLYEFNNGQNSGWMYMVNGDHIGFGLRDWKLKDGDEVIWHYVDDYQIEEDEVDWSDPNATDRKALFGGGGSDTNAAATIEMEATIQQDTGIATAKVEEEQITEASKAALQDTDQTGNLKINITCQKPVTEIQTQLPASVFTKITEQSSITGLMIATPLFTMTLDENAVKALGENKFNGAVVFTMALDSGVLENETAEAPGDLGCRIAVQLGDSNISVLEEGNATITLPQVLKENQLAMDYQLYRLTPEGNWEEMEQFQYNPESKSFVFTTNEFSSYVFGQQSKKGTEEQPLVTETSNESIELPFSDIADHWAKDAILFVTEKGIFFGKADGSFAPDELMTRGMLVTVLGKYCYGDTSLTYDFADVDQNQYYAPYVAWAAHKGIVKGKTDTTFAPDDPITKEQLAVILNNYLNFLGKNIPTQNENAIFADAMIISPWAQGAVNQLHKKGIMSGISDYFFEPQKDVTRAEVAVVLQKLVTAMTA